jgi:hypothetical protein
MTFFSTPPCVCSLAKFSLSSLASSLFARASHHLSIAPTLAAFAGHGGAGIVLLLTAVTGLITAIAKIIQAISGSKK